MHIKQVIVDGFKSYRELTAEPFDERHNVVVGRNGSGKTNFFQAIQFVLSDEFTRLRAEQRSELLHEGAGPRVASAHVEIVFDNSDRRIPMAPKEVRVRRAIGAQKDQFFLNGKPVPRTEVVDLLESAGLSDSNPYYIVKQGKIDQMATAPDSQRLELLKEVAGTRTYYRRQKEWTSALPQIAEKAERVDEFLRVLEDRLNKLKEEKEGLEEYLRWDELRRNMEYHIHVKETLEDKDKLEDLEFHRRDMVREHKRFADLVREAQGVAKDLGRQLRDARREALAVCERRDLLSTEHHRLLGEKTKLDLTIKDLTDDVDGDDKFRKKTEEELEKISTAVADKRKELEELKPIFKETKEREEDCLRILASNEQKLQELYAKHDRGTRFASKRDRDIWIENELKSLDKQLEDKKDHEVKLCDDLERDGDKLLDIQNRLIPMTYEMIGQKEAIIDHNHQYYESKKNRDRAQFLRNELWRKETTMIRNLSSLEENFAKADLALRSMAGKSISNGLDSVRKVLDTFKQKGGEWAEIAEAYYGPVIENFSCEKLVYTAVEVTAGNRLFHHIVESDVVGTKIIKEINQQNLPGEVTFMPLNRLQVKDISYPCDNNAIAMVTKLTYNAKCEKAIKSMFSKTLICRNLDYAIKLGERSYLNSVTLEGDQVDFRGPLTGGYFNPSRSRLEMQKTKSELMEQIKTSQEELDKLRTELQATESNINVIISDMQNIQIKQDKARNIFDKVKADIRLVKDEISSIERFRNPKEKSLALCRSSLEAMRATKESLEFELHQELKEQFSAADQGIVDELNDAIRRLNQEHKEAFSARMNLEANKNKIENLLTNNLIRRKDELVQALLEMPMEDCMLRLSNSKADVLAIEKRIETISKDLEDMDKLVQEAMNTEMRLKTELLEWEIYEKQAQNNFIKYTKSLEKSVSKEVLIRSKIKESMKKMAALGTLPPAPVLVKLNKLQLVQELKTVNYQTITRFKDVNKKALDQFSTFSEQKEKLNKRKEKLCIELEKARGAIDTLEHQRLEAVQLTFKQVTKNFTDIFQKLVPTGRGNLIMRIAQEDGVEIRPEDVNVDQFVGVGINVSFTGGDAEMREINQLSGGQKSLVALTLIFAIQKCDPAPFYLFDEIDQALDAQHRRAIANIIHELSSSAQFITTTFRPELLEHAQKFYGVKFRNKVSHVECVTKEEARGFVEDSATHD